MRKNKVLLQIVFLITVLFTICILIIYVYILNQKTLKLKDSLIKSEKILNSIVEDNFFEYNDLIHLNKHISNELKHLMDTTAILFIIKTPICLSCVERFLGTLENAELPILLITDTVGYGSIHYWLKNNHF